MILVCMTWSCYKLFTQHESRCSLIREWKGPRRDGLMAQWFRFLLKEDIFVTSTPYIWTIWSCSCTLVLFPLYYYHGNQSGPFSILVDIYISNTISAITKEIRLSFTKPLSLFYIFLFVYSCIYLFLNSYALHFLHFSLSLWCFIIRFWIWSNLYTSERPALYTWMLHS